MALVDANVLLDLLTDDSEWRAWSVAALEDAVLDAPLSINEVVYAEISVGFKDQSPLDAFLAEAEIGILPMPREALFLAGKAHQRYRSARDTRTGVLPDFFVGAHATVLGVPLLTRDGRRFRTYFPQLALIAP